MACSSDSKEMISAWNLMFSCVPAMALKCALLLKIPDIIASAGPDGIAALSIPQIAARMEKPPKDLDYLSRIVRYLSSIGVFEEMEINGGEIVYGLTHMTKTYFVTQGNPANFAAYHLFFNDEVSQAAWHCLQESVVEGGDAFHIVHGRELWDYAKQDARYNRLFNTGMHSLTLLLIKDVFADYDGLKEVTTLVDIGGGLGGTLAEIMAVHPHIRGINFDLPHVVANAPQISGVEHVAGNMFDSIPSGDAFLLKHVLHDWDDACCTKILKNCYEALPEKGKLILVEGVIDSSQHSYKPLQMSDLTMFAFTSGGKERSLQQWMELLGKVGFHISMVVGREENLLKIIEAIKV